MSPLLASLLAGIAICYFACGVPFGLVIARAHGVDVRKVGSGNIGTTNVARSVGKAASAETLACDVAKGWLCMLAARAIVAAAAFGGDFAMTRPQTSFGWVTTVFFLACICGHVFSPYLRFHGGKGIAVGFGAGLGCYWPLSIGLLVVFILVVMPTRYVSAGSIAADVSVPVWGLVFGFTRAAIPPLVAIALIVLWAHRSNIKKLIHGEESKFAFKK